MVFGINHRTASAQECCDKCQQHAAHPRNKKRPCNSWVFCPLPICWGLDTGWNHTFGECWLKFQPDPSHALYGQRGAYTPEYRHKYRYIRTGAPSHVPWTGGIIGGPPVDTTVSWTTGIEGMKSSRGDELTVRPRSDDLEIRGSTRAPSHISSACRIFGLAAPAELARVGGARRVREATGKAPWRREAKGSRLSHCRGARSRCQCVPPAIVLAPPRPGRVGQARVGAR